MVKCRCRRHLSGVDLAQLHPRGNSGAYLVLKFTLPLIRVAPLAVGSAPAPLRSRRANSVGPVRELYRHGISKAEIARRLHIGRTSVRRILRERIRS
jgi:hypothetical protein